VAKFTYVESERFGSSPELHLYGVDWRLGEVGEVTEPAYVDKLRTIDAFIEVKPGRPSDENAEKVAAAKAKAQAQAQKFKPVEENGEPAKPKAKASQSTIADLGPHDAWDDEDTKNV
jgi:hypothetical protein